MPAASNVCHPERARDGAGLLLRRTGHFTANRHSLFRGLLLLPACDRFSAAAPLSRVAWMPLLCAALPPSTGRCNQSAACDDLPRTPGMTAVSVRQRPTDY